MIYKILLLISCLFFLLSFRKRKKIKRKVTFQDIEPKLNTYLKLLQYNKGSKEYQRLERKLKGAGIKLKPETYCSLNFLFSICVVLLFVLFKIFGYFNKLVNIDMITKAAEVLNNPNLLEIKLSVKLPNVLIVFLIAYALPNIIIKITGILRRAAAEKEILLLQSYTVIMLRTGIPVKRILNNLSLRAKIYRSDIEMAVKKFSTNPESALKELKDSFSNNNFRKTCIALEQALKTDKDFSLAYLEKNRAITREINKQYRLRKNKRNEIIGTLLMVFPLFMLIAIGAYPWIIYILKLLNNIPM